MTSNECCDIVGWRAYLGTSQRNHDHQCSKSLPWTALVYTVPMVLAVNWSLRFFADNVRVRRQEKQKKKKTLEITSRKLRGSDMDLLYGFIWDRGTAGETMLLRAVRSTEKAFLVL
jgi:hypothetical protein